MGIYFNYVVNFFFFYDQVIYWPTYFNYWSFFIYDCTFDTRNPKKLIRFLLFTLVFLVFLILVSIILYNVGRFTNIF